jgi:hypothetical protein
LDDAYETTGLQKPEQQDATRIETPNYDLNFNGALNNTGEDN